MNENHPSQTAGAHLPPALPSEDTEWYKELGWLVDELPKKVVAGFKAEKVKDSVLDDSGSTPYCEQRLFMSSVQVSISGGDSVFSRLEELAYDIGNVLGGRAHGTRYEEERPTPLERGEGYVGMATFVVNQNVYHLRYSVMDNRVSIEAIAPNGRPELLVLQRTEWAAVSEKLESVCSTYLNAPSEEDRQLDLSDEPRDFPPEGISLAVARYSRADLERLERFVLFDATAGVLYVEHFSPEFPLGVTRDDGSLLPSYLLDKFMLHKTDVARIGAVSGEKKMDLLNEIAEARLSEKYLK